MHITHEDNMIPDSFESPESSLIVRASYDEEQQVLSLYFRKTKKEGEKHYDYNIPPALWAEFVQAPSKGAFFSQRIRPWFGGRIQIPD